MDNKLMWWGYEHTEGTLQVKRYFDKRDIEDAKQSPFCEIIVGPFEAEDREEALFKIHELIGEIKNS